MNTLNQQTLARIKQGFEDLQRITQNQEVDLARVEERVKSLSDLLNEVKESMKVMDVEITDMGRNLATLKEKLDGLKEMSSGEWVAPVLAKIDDKKKGGTNIAVWLAVISMVTAIGTAAVNVIPKIIEAYDTPEGDVVNGETEKP